MSQAELEKLRDDQLDGTCGWIDTSGAFYPCEHYAHSQLMYDILDLGLYDGIRDFEEHMVKITLGGKKDYVFLTYAERLTARQKLTLSKLIEKHDMMHEGQSELLADREILFQDGHVVFRKAM